MDSERNRASRDNVSGDTEQRASRGATPRSVGTQSAATHAPGAPTAGPSAGALPQGGAAPPDEARAAAAAAIAETPRERRLRTARRVGLYLYAFLALAVIAYLIALGASNTTSVAVSWVFGTSSVPLVWLVLSAAILGFSLGMLVSLLIRWRTRRRKQRVRD